MGAINTVYDGGYYNFRLRSGQIPEFLIGLYGRLAFGMSRYTYVSSEGAPFIGYNTKDGGYVAAGLDFPNSASNADTLLMLRNALVLEKLKDNVETGDVDLLRGAPRAWLDAGQRIRVERMVTYYGEIGTDAATPRTTSSAIRACRGTSSGLRWSPPSSRASISSRRSAPATRRASSSPLSAGTRGSSTRSSSGSSFRTICAPACSPCRSS